MAHHSHTLSSSLLQSSLPLSDDDVPPNKPVRVWTRTSIIRYALLLLSLVLVALLICLPLIFLLPVPPSGPVVDLGYAKYRGVVSPHNINQYLGLRYAAPPLGKLRFAEPRDPPSEKRVINADKHGKICISTSRAVSGRASEDCLFINVYAPANATSDSKLPVYFFIQGGGFNANSDFNYDGTGLIKASEMNIVVVTFNYRVGPYGFLAGKEVEADGSLNNGLKDQIKALEWVNKYIQKFGGNPDHVVLGGHSAGAASVILLLTAYGGSNEKLFHGAVIGSASFGAMLTTNGSQHMYNHLVRKTGCKGENDTLACLRKLDVKTVQANTSKYPLPGAKSPPLFMYSPTIDGDLIRDYTSALLQEGNFVRVPIILGGDTNEGTIFAPKKTKSIQQSDRFLRSQWPALSNAQLHHIHTLYPKTNDSFPKSGPYWRQLSNAYGDIRYTCPSISMSQLFSKHLGQLVYNYEYAVEDPSLMARGIGTPHTNELNAIWGPRYISHKPPPSYNTTNEPIISVVQDYWTSFIRTFDPNKFRAKGSPEWRTWSGSNYSDTKAMLEKSRNGPAATPSDGFHKLFIRTNATRMKTVSKKQRKKCEYLTGIGDDIKQ